MAKEIKLYFSKREISEMYGISVSKINRAMTNGLPYQKLGVTVRFKVEDVEKYYNIKKENK